MIKRNSRWLCLKLAVTAVFGCLLTDIAGAQTYFLPTGYGDMIAGFRKTGSFIESYEMVVDLGNITNLLSLGAGVTINLTNYSHTQMTNMCPDNLDNLQWSVAGSFPPTGVPDGPWVTPIGSFPKATCWYTVHRASVTTQSTPPNRIAYSALGILRGRILGAQSGATSISQALGTTNQFNNSLLVTEPISFTDNILTAFIGDMSDSTIGDFGGQAISYSVENTTPEPFSAIARSDLYQNCPISYLDPISGKTTGATYYVGYFTLNTDGTMTFTRAGGTVTPPPPPPTVLTIITTISNGGGGSSQVNSMISFGTTNGATYTLRYTNSAGLTAPLSTWPIATGTISGDGLTHTFTNSSTDSSRFYRVSGQ